MCRSNSHTAMREFAPARCRAARRARGPRCPSWPAPVSNGTVGRHADSTGTGRRLGRPPSRHGPPLRLVLSVWLDTNAHGTGELCMTDQVERGPPVAGRWGCNKVYGCATPPPMQAHLDMNQERHLMVCTD